MTTAGDSDSEPADKPQQAKLSKPSTPAGPRKPLACVSNNAASTVSKGKPVAAKAAAETRLSADHDSAAKKRKTPEAVTANDNDADDAEEYLPVRKQRPGQNASIVIDESDDDFA